MGAKGLQGEAVEGREEGEGPLPQGAVLLEEVQNAGKGFTGFLVMKASRPDWSFHSCLLPPGRVRMEASWRGGLGLTGRGFFLHDTGRSMSFASQRGPITPGS